MTIHVWKHWFWITYRFLIPFLCLEIAASVVPNAGAGLLHVNETVAKGDKYEAVVNTEATSNDAADVSGPAWRSSSDMDDTFNGESSDVIIPHPVKKYHAKYSDHVPAKKYWTKGKPESTVSERVEWLNIGIQQNIDGNSSQSLTPSTTPDKAITADRNSSYNSSNTEEVLGDEPLDIGVANTTIDGSLQLNETENYAEDVDPTSMEPFSFEGKMAVAAATSVDHARRNSSALDAGSITGIILGIVVISGLFGAISFVLYRRRYLNKPQALTDKSSTLDSSGYIDDASLRENSEEMYSLDNDSFLNSLEAMTIQNYWTESVKHTKL